LRDAVTIRSNRLFLDVVQVGNGSQPVRYLAGGDDVAEITIVVSARPRSRRSAK
jgi:hypothetical protein